MISQVYNFSFSFSLKIVKARNIETQVFLNASEWKKGRQSVTKRSNGWNLIVGGVRFDSGVECYGNKSVNKMRRDCLAANKPRRPFAKARREKEKERESAYYCSPASVSVTRETGGLMICRRFSRCTYIHINAPWCRWSVHTHKSKCINSFRESELIRKKKYFH